jgi:ABC-type branched-subunit amino acid transport system substrate-binding protein
MLFGRTLGLFTILAGVLAAQETVKLGFNYPRTGPYAVQGLDQLRAAEMAVEEINAAGGILGRRAELAIRDSQSKPDVTKANVTELIDKEGAKMVFGGSASNVAVAAGHVCWEKQVPFFGTLTYSTATTCEEGHRTTFRECYDAWPAAKVLAEYMNRHYAGKKFLYVTADYTWGHTTEASFRKFTGTEDREKHKVMLTPFPTATEEHFKKAAAFAKMVSPDVLVVVEFGKDMEMAIRQATALGLKSKMAIVVPNLTLGMAEGAGPKVMEGVIGALPWAWNIPYQFGFDGGKRFVEKFAAKHGRYPCTSGASAYTIVHEYKAAVERAGTFDTPAVVRALEGHEYTLLKDKQTWRPFDHQSIQTVYAVRCKPEAEVNRDKYRLDYFEVIGSMAGNDCFRTLEEWQSFRKQFNKPLTLELFPGETARPAK